MHHHVSRVLPYTPDQLFGLVGDVDRYPEFVPWITSMRTWNARTLGEGVESVDAEAGVGFSFLRERFATRVHRDAAARRLAAATRHLLDRKAPFEVGYLIEVVARVLICRCEGVDERLVLLA